MKKIYYNNGKNEIRLNEDQPCPEGWYKGRLKPPITTGGCIWINNGIQAKFIKSTEPIPSGWVKGRLKSHLNISKITENKINKKYKHYTDGVNDLLIPRGQLPPKGFNPGRPSPNKESRDKMSKSHLGLKHSSETKHKISINSNNNREKAFKTIQDKYGSTEDFYTYIHEKGEVTKVANKTFNTSKPENQMYSILCQTYGKENILRNYKCDRYPFRCDFYIKPLDKFIELNLHWTHGSRPYIEDDDFCKTQLLEWKEKAKTSKYYSIAIETWTKRDVEKARLAKDNHLNYEVIY